jgi:hypothetical protein
VVPGIQYCTDSFAGGKGSNIFIRVIKRFKSEASRLTVIIELLMKNGYFSQNNHHENSSCTLWYAHAYMLLPHGF